MLHGENCCARKDVLKVVNALKIQLNDKYNRDEAPAACTSMKGALILCMGVLIALRFFLKICPDQWHTFARQLARGQGVVCDQRIVFLLCGNHTCNLGCSNIFLQQKEPVEIEPSRVLYYHKMKMCPSEVSLHF